METEELQKKDKEELETLLQTTRKKVSDLRFQLSQSKLKNVQELKSLRKTIARILTFLKGK